jgi:hypothetical protein
VSRECRSKPRELEGPRAHQLSALTAAERKALDQLLRTLLRSFESPGS